MMWSSKTVKYVWSQYKTNLISDIAESEDDKGAKQEEKGQTIKHWLSKLGELRKEVDGLRATICNQYAEDMGQNLQCATQWLEGSQRATENQKEFESVREAVSKWKSKRVRVSKRGIKERLKINNMVTVLWPYSLWVVTDINFIIFLLTLLNEMNKQSHEKCKKISRFKISLTLWPLFF